MNAFRFIVFALLVFVLSPLAQARIQVFASSGGTYTLVQHEPPDDNLYDLELHATTPDTVTAFTIVRSEVDDVLSVINIYSSNAGGTTELIIGSYGQEVLRIDEINLLDNDGFTSVSRMNIAGDLGPTTLNALIDSRVGGDITGELRLRAFPARTPVLQAWILGDVLADVILEDSGEPPLGVIDILSVYGTIGTSSAPVDIRVGGWLIYLDAGEINATIRGYGESGPSSFVQQVFWIETLQLDGSSGDIRGEMRCRITGYEDFFEHEQVIRAAGDIEGTIYIGGSFAEKQAFENEIESYQQAGMKGRVIINADNESGGWTAPVNIGPSASQISLTGSNYVPANTYPHAAASIGGGTIGVVPFQLHRSDCVPFDGQAIAPGIDTIKKRHYGAVTWNPDNGNPYQVERRKNGSSDSWVLQDCFTCQIDPSNDSIVLVKTDPIRKLQRGYEYRVSRRTFDNGGVTENVLRCHKLPDDITPPVANFDPLVFSVCDSAALGDADDNGCVNFADITCVLANYCSGSNCCMRAGDADRDNDVDSADMAQVLTSWGNSYCGSCSSGFAASSNHSMATMDLESDGPSFASTLSISDALLAMGYPSIGDFVDAIFAMDDASREAEVHRLGQLLGAE